MRGRRPRGRGYLHPGQRDALSRPTDEGLALIDEALCAVLAGGLGFLARRYGLACDNLLSADVVTADTAFATVYGASWPDSADAADAAANVAWSRAYDKALAPYADQAGYVNFLAAGDSDRVPASYRQNYDRLVAVKRRYDPANLFRLNDNIAP